MEENSSHTSGASGDTMIFKNVFGRLRKKQNTQSKEEEKNFFDPEDSSDSIAEANQEQNEGTGDMSRKQEKNTEAVKEPEIVTEEISIDIDDIKQNIAQAVEEAFHSCAPSAAVPCGSAPEDIVKRLEEVSRGLESVKRRLQAIQMATEEGIKENSGSISSLNKPIYELKDAVSEITQTMNGVSKVSDSVFDLKNAQTNMKKSIDALETELRRLKKKLAASAAALSVIGVLIMALQIIALLS